MALNPYNFEKGGKAVAKVREFEIKQDIQLVDGGSYNLSCAEFKFGDNLLSTEPTLHGLYIHFR